MRALLLIASLYLVVAAEAHAQAPDVPSEHLARVRTLLDDPQLHQLQWRQQLFQSVRRLEFGPVELVRAAWEALDLPGDDRAHSNLLVYLRRHGLPLPEPRLNEAGDSLLERALAAWGQLDLARARALLEQGAESYPENLRFANNLPWLPVIPPTPVRVDPQQGSRELARDVLALRIART
jgi:hypothetical protein